MARLNPSVTSEEATMRAVDVIERKRDGCELTTEEIRFFIQGYAEDRIPDYQAAAWAMAVLLRGMSVRETIDLTMAMVASGETLSMRRLGPIVVDKHSTGGVGDKTTLIVGPLVAEAGLPVAKMSGRGLGYSGGTLDKLEAIPGFRVDLSPEAFYDTIAEHGMAVVSQTADLAPADGKLYALRDVTGTVPSLPLIASSIMCKKIAGGADAIVLDVKAGRGAFMETVEEARELAEHMIDIGHGVQRRVTAVLADMNQPLGRAIGNSLEVIEAIETLRGEGPEDLREHCLTLGAEMLLLGHKADTPQAAQEQLGELLDSGRALERFRRWVAAQGGDPGIVDDLTRLPQAPVQHQMAAPRGGHIAGLDARTCGLTAVTLGAGREVKGAPIDPGVGLVLHAKVGDTVHEGEPLLTVHARTRQEAQAAAERLLAAYDWSDSPVQPRPLIYEILRESR
jgi:pyrimidine-nucleoside phosphorylase